MKRWPSGACPPGVEFYELDMSLPGDSRAAPARHAGVPAYRFRSRNITSRSSDSGSLTPSTVSAACAWPR